MKYSCLDSFKLIFLSYSTRWSICFLCDWIRLDWIVIFEASSFEILLVVSFAYFLIWILFTGMDSIIFTNSFSNQRRHGVLCSLVLDLYFCGLHVYWRRHDVLYNLTSVLYFFTLHDLMSISIIMDVDFTVWCWSWCNLVK